jgi:hypothetical protein
VEGSRSSDIDLKFLKKMVATLWEGSCKKVKGKMVTPAAAVFIDSNSLPADIIPFLGESADKIKFLATGFQSLDHEEKMELIQELLKEAYKLYSSLPVHLAVILNSVMKKISSAEMKDVAGLLKNPKDDREGQVLV